MGHALAGIGLAQAGLEGGVLAGLQGDVVLDGARDHPGFRPVKRLGEGGHLVVQGWFQAEADGEGFGHNTASGRVSLPSTTCGPGDAALLPSNRRNSGAQG
jgi:hypothetical protein